jgi:polyribonucleotide nucleotidyltransferase
MLDMEGTKKIKVEAQLPGNPEPIRIETGHVANLADGAVIVSQGETMVLVTAVMDDKPMEDIDFTPLAVEYREQTAAFGRIPGGFSKREGKPLDREVLVARVIDRPIRPLFPKDFYYDTIITALLLSADDKYDPDVLAITGASAALHISRIPWEGPIAGIRVCRINGKFVVNPTYEERKQADLDIVMAGTKEGIVMVEGGGKEIPEEVLNEALYFGHSALQPLIEIQEELREKVGRPKLEYEKIDLPEEWKKKIREFASEKIYKALFIKDKRERKEKLESILEETIKALNIPEELLFRAKVFYKELESEIMRKHLFDNRIRIDGRKPDEIRPIEIEIHPFPRPHGSALFRRGQTQAAVSVTLGSPEEAQLEESIYEGEWYRRFMLHYFMPPFSTGEAKPWGPPRRREIGHGYLAQRALEPVIPSEEEFPYTIRVVSNILESNGSTSMATVCGASLALFDAGVPMKRHVAGIAMGLVMNEKTGEYIILTDILGDEDHLGDMDFKVAGTRQGITSIQMDIKVKGITKEIMADALQKAKSARHYILSLMYKAIKKPREKLSPYAPRLAILEIPAEKGTLIIGPGGKTVRDIQEKTGATVWVLDGGKVSIKAPNEESLSKAQRMIEEITKDLEVGNIYVGKVIRVEPYGAFVEILPGKVGLLHVSKIPGFVKDARELYKVGDIIKVKVAELDELGRPRFTTKGISESQRIENLYTTEWGEEYRKREEENKNK